MMREMFVHADADTPVPGLEWSRTTNEERLLRVGLVLSESPERLREAVRVVEARADGQVLMEFVKPLKADERGVLLLDVEEYLKKRIDSGLVVWLKAIGDRNTLRHMRGITVKEV